MWLLVFDFICVCVCCVQLLLILAYFARFGFSFHFAILFSSSTSEDGLISYQWLFLEWSTAKSQVRLVSDVTIFDIVNILSIYLLIFWCYCQRQALEVSLYCCRCFLCFFLFCKQKLFVVICNETYTHQAGRRYIRYRELATLATWPDLRENLR